MLLVCVIASVGVLFAGVCVAEVLEFELAVSVVFCVALEPPATTEFGSGVGVVGVVGVVVVVVVVVGVVGVVVVVVLGAKLVLGLVVVPVDAVGAVVELVVGVVVEVLLVVGAVVLVVVVLVVGAEVVSVVVGVVAVDEVSLNASALEECSIAASDIPPTIANAIKIFLMITFIVQFPVKINEF